MDFSLNKEQEMFRESIRQFLETHGQTNVARKYIEGEDASFKKLWTGLSELGYTGVTVSEDYDGLGLGLLDLIPILEEMGRTLIPGTYVETVALAAPLLQRFGTAEQKRKYLPGISSGERTFTLAWVEPNGGYDPNEINMTAKLDGEMYILNGRKTMVLCGDDATTLIVPVRTEESESVNGISLLLIDNADVDLEYKVQKCYDETRRLVEITFSNVRISRENILGTVNTGWDVLQEGLLFLNAALCSTMVGGMERAVNMSVEYANTRVQFGQPIGRFQAIKHRIVDMKMDQETARSLTYYAIWAMDTEAPDRIAAVFSARSFINEAFIRVAGHNIQNHGGMGYTKELDCHLYLKRARSLENYLGLSEDLREKAAVSLCW
ncbi:acyl-CoA dehydrogenase family protein [Peribacillus frigoritolerans]